MLSSPASSLSLAVGDSDSAEAPHLSALQLLEMVPLFSALTREERRTLADTVAIKTYRKDEVVVRQGQMLSTLMVVRSGVLVLTRQETRGEDELTRLAPGDVFGENALLTGAGEPGTLTAIAPTVLFELNQSSLTPLLNAHPELGSDLAALLTHRFEISLRDSHSPRDLARRRSVVEMLKSMETAFLPPGGP